MQETRRDKDKHWFFPRFFLQFSKISTRYIAGSWVLKSELKSVLLAICYQSGFYSGVGRSRGLIDPYLFRGLRSSEVLACVERTAALSSTASNTPASSTVSFAGLRFSWLIKELDWCELIGALIGARIGAKGFIKRASF